MAYTRQQKDRFFEVLRSTGQVAKSLRAAGMSRGQAYTMRKRNATFRRKWTDAVNDAKMQHVEEAEETLFQRAVKGVKVPVYYKGAVCGYKTVYSDQLLIRYLEAKKPEEFGRSQSIEHSGEIGGQATVVMMPALRPTDEDEPGE